MVVVTNGERRKHPDFIKNVFLGVRSSPQQSRYLASKMLEPSVKTRSIELSIYTSDLCDRAPAFCLAASAMYEAVSRWDIIEDVTEKMGGA